MSDSIKNMVRVVAYPHGDGWIASCVEYDICAQGSDLASVRRNMTATLMAECKFTMDNYGEAFKGIDPAPDFIAALFKEAEESSLQSDYDFRIAA